MPIYSNSCQFIIDTIYASGTANGQSKILEILQPRQGLLVKPLLYKDEMASAPTQKHLSEVLSEVGEEDLKS